MSKKKFIQNQFNQILEGGIITLLSKINAIRILFLKSLLYIFALAPLILIRLIRPFFLIRWDTLRSSRIGHFVCNTEMYLCERDVGIDIPRQSYIDIFCFEQSICNYQIAEMYKRILHVWPRWILDSMAKLNQVIPGGDIHEIKKTLQPGAHLDIQNLLDRTLGHLIFNENEKEKGEAELRKMGIPLGAPIVCLIVRDSAYLNVHESNGNWNYHNYRDCDIQNFVSVSEYLASRGYYIVRMGAVVHEKLKCNNPKVIDYATNGMRTDFMDIYLGFACTFCISTSTGWDGVPSYGFRKPTIFTNILPIGYLLSFSNLFTLISKKFILIKEKRELTLKEIFKHQVGYGLDTSDYESKGISLVENTPEEIREIASEMADRIENKWITTNEDIELQKKFWQIFPITPTAENNFLKLHGEIRSRYGASYLRNNPTWLD